MGSKVSALAGTGLGPQGRVPCSWCGLLSPAGPACEICGSPIVEVPIVEVPATGLPGGRLVEAARPAGVTAPRVMAAPPASPAPFRLPEAWVFLPSPEERRWALARTLASVGAVVLGLAVLAELIALVVGAVR